MLAVLLIEDDAVIARVMSTHLRHAGFDVEWAEDGQRGLRKLPIKARPARRLAR